MALHGSFLRSIYRPLLHDTEQSEAESLESEKKKAGKHPARQAPPPLKQRRYIRKHLIYTDTTS